MTTLRWVFIRPRCGSPYYDPEIQEPLGLEYLCASRQSKGDAVLLMDAILESMGDIRLARRAVSFQPDAICFSIMSAHELASVSAIYDECRKKLSGHEIYWLAGGNFISHEPDQALALLPDDFHLVRFEGENALAQLTAEWSEHRDAKGGHKKLTARVSHGAPVGNPDTLPFPVRPFADRITSAGNAFNIQGSRGCLGACRYCSSPEAKSIQRSHWRGRSMEHIAAEMAELNRIHGARAFNFIDEDFLGPNALATSRARRFVDELTRRGLQISFSIQVRPDSLNIEIIDLLSAHGLCYVFIGIESDDPRDFARWGRPWTGPPWDLVTHIRRHHIEVGAGVLLFHPHSTFRGIRRFAEILHQHGLLNFRSAINRMDAMPGSVFHRWGLESGELSPVAGPQPLAFQNKGIESFYHALTTALSPLGPTAMHAVCCLPPMIAKFKLNSQYKDAYQDLKKIIHDLDRAVARTMTMMLKEHDKGRSSAISTSGLREENLQISLEAAHALVNQKLAPSFGQLREAVRMDAEI